MNIVAFEQKDIWGIIIWLFLEAKILSVWLMITDS